MLKKLLSGLVLGLAITSSSCSTVEHRYVQEPIPIPDRPVLPRILAADLMCLSATTYESLVERDATQAAHIMRLENLLRTTHDNDTQ